MNNKDFKNLQNSLYNNILPPPESLKHSRSEGFDTHKSLNHTPDLSDSEHTQSSQTRSDERFRMTEKSPLSLGEGWGEGWHWQKALKTAALTLALSFFIAAPAMAQAPVPTLDNLHNHGITMPDSSEVYPESAYTLTEIENADPENLPQNAITLYDKNEDGTVTPKYYLVNLKDSVTNIGEGDSTKYFEWSQNSEGKLELKEVSAPTEGKTTITVKYDNADTGAYDKTYINQNKQETHTPVNNSGVTTELPGGAAINNTSQDAVSINNTLFQNNITNLQANISGSYSGNSKYNYVNVYGGALYNAGDISSLSADFVENSLILDFSYDSSKYQRNYPLASGGAFYNAGQMGNVSGNFVNNSVVINAVSNSTAHPELGLYSQGGAIGNGGVIDTIEGVFAGNFVTGNYNVTDDGGSIYKYRINSQGGAISNTGEIKNINADFINNYAEGGEQIHNGNDSQFEINNQVFAEGGAIYNDEDSKIGNIAGDFIGNYASGSSSAYGGAIYNRRTIGNITGDFIGNYASGNSSVSGGAIYNAEGYNSNSIIGNITGDFIGNYASGNSSVSGGAIFNNRGTIGNITGDFIGNYASSIDSIAQGGAIYNYNSNAQIGDITGDFISNYASSTDSSAAGGAIFNNYGTIGNITGDFIGNYVSGNGYGYNKDVVGGAIYNNNGTIGSKDDEGNVVGGLINSSFIGNYATATAENGTAQGGAIWTNNDLNIIAKDGGQSVFSGNYATATAENGTAQGGAIWTNNDLNIIAKDGGQSVFSGNYVQDKDGKRQEAIYVNNNISAGSTQTEVVSVDADKIIYQEKSSNFDSFDPADNPTLTLNANTNGVIQFDDQISGDNSNLVNNTYQMNIIGMAQDFSGKDDMYAALGLSDDATVSEVVDAYIDFMQKQYPDEPLPENAKELVLQQFIKMGALETSDPELISGETLGSYNLKITGDSTGKVVLNNDVINANIYLDNTNLYLGREDVFNQSQSLSLNSGSIYMNNQSVGTMHVPTLNLNGNTNISVDADLASKTMDRITADTYNVTDGAMLNVNNVVLLSDAKEDVTNIQFADDELASNVAFTGASPIAYSPIWKYDISYNPDDGFFSFVRGAASSGNASDAFNPSVLASPVATQAGAYTTQLQTFNYAFQHADTFMNIPYLERVAIINQGKYAMSPTGDATDVGTYSPLLLKEESAGFWVKPYASFENVPLKNGPKVSNINYGTLIGYDSPLQSISNGFERVLTGYIGYNGASQRYSGVDAYQNGGLLGGTATFYKGNFFNATTLSVGASAGDASTMYGSENYTMLLAGLGNKTGYNFEFFDGGMILQPSMLISYTFVNTFDYNNAAGVRIESDPMHAIQLAPGIKLIGNTKNGWQPYIGVSMVWNLLDESKVTADSVRLPEMSIKPYVQYGVGLQKRVNDKFLAFGQAMIHNGGRNGVSLSAGLRWKIGRE